MKKKNIDDLFDNMTNSFNEFINDINDEVLKRNDPELFMTWNNYLTKLSDLQKKLEKKRK